MMDRRKFIQVSALGAAAAMLPGEIIAKSGQTASSAITSKLSRNCSNFKGLQIGAISYSWRAQGSTAGDQLLFALGSGVGSVELMGNSAQSFAGKPGDPFDAATAAECLVKYKQLGQLFRQAGVDIHILKLSPNDAMSDQMLDFIFDACAAIGADGVTTELDLETAERVGKFARKHGKYLIFHNHGQHADPKFEGYDEFIKKGDNIMFNFDAGHYFGFTGKNPCDVIKEYHDRIYSVHLKDKTSPTNAISPNKNKPWGQGETPLEEVLTLCQKNAKKADWPKHCDIELEYEVPETSTPVIEVAKCVAYCKKILL